MRITVKFHTGSICVVDIFTSTTRLTYWYSPVLQETGLKVHMVPLESTAFAPNTRESTQEKCK